MMYFCWRLLKQADQAQFERLRAEEVEVRIGAFDDLRGGRQWKMQVADRLFEIVNMNTELFQWFKQLLCNFSNKGHRGVGNLNHQDSGLALVYVLFGNPWRSV